METSVLISIVIVNFLYLRAMLLAVDCIRKVITVSVVQYTTSDRSIPVF